MEALESNLAKLQASWSPETPIIPLFGRVPDCQKVAEDSGDPISAAQVLRIMHSIIKATGVFAEPLDQWNERPVAKKTWTNFETAFQAH